MDSGMAVLVLVALVSGIASAVIVVRADWRINEMKKEVARLQELLDAYRSSESDLVNKLSVVEMERNAAIKQNQRLQQQVDDYRRLLGMRQEADDDGLGGVASEWWTGVSPLQVGVGVEPLTVLAHEHTWSVIGFLRTSDPLVVGPRV